jgi:hypothetical protein
VASIVATGQNAQQPREEMRELGAKEAEEWRSPSAKSG